MTRNNSIFHFPKSIKFKLDRIKLNHRGVDLMSQSQLRQSIKMFEIYKQASYDENEVVRSQTMVPIEAVCHPCSNKRIIFHYMKILLPCL